ncbi:phosphoglycolate phosphatase [Caminibacter profundus]
MKAVFFDLDGTLIDSAEDLANSINFMLKSIGKNPYDIELIKTWVGNGATMLVKRALSGSFEIGYIDENEFKKALNIFMEHYKNNLCIKTQMYPGVKETLDKLKAKKLAIITNKPFKFVTPILKEFKIDGYFDLILGGDSLDEKKPSKKPLLFACEKLNVSPSDTIMVGDSKNDIFAAKRAGIKSIAITHGYSQGEDIKGLDADFVVDDIREILKVIYG